MNRQTNINEYRKTAHLIIISIQKSRKKILELHTYILRLALRNILLIMICPIVLGINFQHLIEYDNYIDLNNFIKTRMTTFTKTKFKKSDDQTNIDKYRLAANITEEHIISKLILQRIIITNLCGPVSHLR